MLSRLISKFRAHKRLAAIVEKAPCICVADHGWATDKPQVSVSLQSSSGVMSVFAYPSDETGHARATLDAISLENITGLPVIDRRPEEWNEAERSMVTEFWVRHPRRGFR